MRIDLPSGGWWELQTRPLWRHVREWDTASADSDASTAVERALVALTIAWSFGEEISLAAVGRRSADDMIAVLRACQQQVAPFLQGVTSRELAQELFAGLVTGHIPPRFAEAHVMTATGWSWQTLQDTPADVVRDVATYLAVTRARETEGELDFPDTEDRQDAQ